MLLHDQEELKKDRFCGWVIFPSIAFSSSAVSVILFCGVILGLIEEDMLILGGGMAAFSLLFILATIFCLSETTVMKYVLWNRKQFDHQITKTIQQSPNSSIGLICRSLQENVLFLRERYDSGSLSKQTAESVDKALSICQYLIESYEAKYASVDQCEVGLERTLEIIQDYKNSCVLGDPSSSE